MGCPCTGPARTADGGLLLVASEFGHTRAAVLAEARRNGLAAHFRDGVLAVALSGRPLVEVLEPIAEALTGPELEEARALVVESGGAASCGADRCAVGAGDLGRALLAPSLAALRARAAHEDLAALVVDERRSFSSVYQPIVRLDDASVVAHEALLRATGPRGPVQPDVLFEAARRAGWLAALDRIGREHAVRGARGWLGGALLVVNVSPTSICRPEVCLRTTERAIEEAGLRLDQVVFEVTEGDQARDVRHLERVLDHYRAMGCKVALDDLGSGFSTLNLLVRLRPDVVKIDRETVQALPGATARALVSAVVEIASTMDTTVLAEGVETAEQAEAARALGVELAQGFHFGRPLPRRSPDAVPA